MYFSAGKEKQVFISTSIKNNNTKWTLRMIAASMELDICRSLFPQDTLQSFLFILPYISFHSQFFSWSFGQQLLLIAGFLKAGLLPSSALICTEMAISNQLEHLLWIFEHITSCRYQESGVISRVPALIWPCKFNIDANGTPECPIKGEQGDSMEVPVRDFVPVNVEKNF